MQIWNIVIKAPMGDIRATLTLRMSDGVVEGEMSGKGGDGPMLDLVLEEDAMKWSTKIERPMPMTLKFAGKIAGDTLSGKVRFGVFASGSFEGERLKDVA